MTELVIYSLAVAATAATALAASCICRTVRRRREARDLERLYVERHPLALTYAEAGRALDSDTGDTAESAETPPPTHTRRIDRPATLAGLTVVALVAALLVIDTAHTPTGDAPAGADGRGTVEPSASTATASPSTVTPTDAVASRRPTVDVDPAARPGPAESSSEAQPVPTITPTRTQSAPESTTSSTADIPSAEDTPGSNDGQGSGESTTTGTSTPDPDPDEGEGDGYSDGPGRPGHGDDVHGRPRPGEVPGHADRGAHKGGEEADGDRPPRLGLLSILAVLIEGAGEADEGKAHTDEASDAAEAD